MLRITLVDATDLAVRLRIEGRLTGRSVEELRQACRLHAPVAGTCLTLDLAGVSFADADGVALLRELKRQNVGLLNLVPFLALRLRNAEDEGPRGQGSLPDERAEN
jgi:ABC-type transporter Mla MlaB component